MATTKKRAKVVKSVLLLVLVAAVIIANVVGNSYSTIISIYLSQQTSKIVQSEEQIDSDYFKTSFSDDTDLYQAGLAFGEEVESEGIVLLKNANNALPLDSNLNISLLSMSSIDMIYGGTGSGSVDTSTAKNLKDVMEDEGMSVNPVMWDFYTENHEDYARSVPSIFASRNNFEINEMPVSEYSADALASWDNYNDVAVVVIARSGGEGDDLSRKLGEKDGGGTYLELTTQEKDLLKYINDYGKFGKIVAVINSSNAMELGYLDQAEYGIDAAVWIGSVGQTGLSAVSKILTGKYNPSGRLVDTYAYDSLGSPAMVNFGRNEYTNADMLNHLAEDYFGIMTQYTGKNYVVYQEGIYVGYRYYETRYEDQVMGIPNTGDFNYDEEVLYPFGYGLSYTSFDYSNFTLTEEGDNFIATVDVTNSGDVAGKEVVQLYFQSPYTDYDKANEIEKAAIELCGFYKTSTLNPGQTESVTISVPKTELRTYDAKGAKTYILDAGDYYFATGKDSHSALNNILQAKGYTVSGNTALTSKWTNSRIDENIIFAENGEKIVNKFEDADIDYYFNNIEYLTRSNWEGTFPTHQVLTASEKLIADLGKEIDLDKDYEMPTTGKNNNLSLITLRGAEYDSPQWDDLLDQLTVEEMITLTTLGGYKTSELPSIGYPGTKDQDGPAGISSTLIGGDTKCMAYPAEVVIAATWNQDMAQALGELVGEDGLHSGVTGWYAPAMNTHRTPYTGRNYEYYSEDGFVAGKIGAAVVKGVQSKGMFAYIKHFALNDQETDRKGIATFSNEQAIREIYLTPFEMSVREGGAKAVMTAHNRIGATWTAGHEVLMNQVLRDEWGFKGHIVSDYVGTPVYQSALQAILAGNDLMLSTRDSNENISKHKDNPYVVTKLREASKNILYSGVNSAAMNGISQTSKIVSVTPAWKIWLRVIDGVFALLIIIGFITIFKPSKKSKEGSELKEA